MSHAHYFVIEDLSVFLADLETRHYMRMPPDSSNTWVTFGKVLSGALVKSYSFPVLHRPDAPVQIRVTYQLIQEGKVLKKLAQVLKKLNVRYRQALPIWKTKRPLGAAMRRKRRQDIQRFLARHNELIRCYRYRAESPATEGNTSFNLHVAATPQERVICLEFVKAILEAYSPSALTRGRRQIDQPRLQRDGWIKRYAEIHKKRGWRPTEIVREIQKELREGTWNERFKLQYNLASNTIGRIAGLKIAHAHFN